MKHGLGLFDCTNSHIRLGFFFIYENKAPNNMNKYLKYNTRYLHRLRNFTYYNVTLPMVVVLLVKSKSILPYAIVDSGLQLNVITYCYKKCKCSEIYKNSSYYLIIFINILQLHKERQLRHMRRMCYISLYYIIIPGGNQLQYVRVFQYA